VCNLKFVKGHITSTPIKFRKLVSTTEYTSTAERAKQKRIYLEDLEITTNHI
jgi:hypothetical protein